MILFFIICLLNITEQRQNKPAADPNTCLHNQNFQADINIKYSMAALVLLAWVIDQLAQAISQLISVSICDNEDVCYMFA